MIENEETSAGDFLDKMHQNLVDNGIIEDADQINYMAVRKGDLFPRFSKDVKWIEWNPSGAAKGLRDEPQLEFSMLMSPFNQYFTWQTTQIDQLIEVSDNMVHFKTRNSEYKLFKGTMDFFKSDEHQTLVMEFINS